MKQPLFAHLMTDFHDAAHSVRRGAETVKAALNDIGHGLTGHRLSPSYKAIYMVEAVGGIFETVVDPVMPGGAMMTIHALNDLRLAGQKERHAFRHHYF